MHCDQRLQTAVVLTFLPRGLYPLRAELKPRIFELLPSAPQNYFMQACFNLNVYMCPMCVPGALLRSEVRASDVLELELGFIGNHCVTAGNWTQVKSKSTKCSLSTNLSFQPHCFGFRKLLSFIFRCVFVSVCRMPHIQCLWRPERAQISWSWN